MVVVATANLHTVRRIPLNEWHKDLPPSVRIQYRRIAREPYGAEPFEMPARGCTGLLRSIPRPTQDYNGLTMDPLIIAGREFRSRLIVGTGKYKSFHETARALEASGADMVTVAVRRVNLDRSKESLLDYIDTNKYFLLPNTAGCYTADDTIRTARLAREVGLSDWIKLEVIGDQATLYPDVPSTFEA